MLCLELNGTSEIYLDTQNGKITIHSRGGRYGIGITAPESVSIIRSDAKVRRSEVRPTLKDLGLEGILYDDFLKDCAKDCNTLEELPSENIDKLICLYVLKWKDEFTCGLFDIENNYKVLVGFIETLRYKDHYKGRQDPKDYGDISALMHCLSWPAIDNDLFLAHAELKKE